MGCGGVERFGCVIRQAATDGLPRATSRGNEPRKHNRDTTGENMARKKTVGPTDRELAILSILWAKGPSTVRDVHEVLHADAETGYTTTLKLMQIMADKGLLVRKDAGRQHIYSPAVSEEKTQKQVVGDLLDRVFAGSAEKLVMRALAARKVSAKELKRIREMLEKIEGE